MGEAREQGRCIRSHGPGDVSGETAAGRVVYPRTRRRNKKGSPCDASDLRSVGARRGSRAGPASDDQAPAPPERRSAAGPDHEPGHLGQLRLGTGREVLRRVSATPVCGPDRRGGPTHDVLGVDRRLLRSARHGTGWHRRRWHRGEPAAREGHRGVPEVRHERRQVKIGVVRPGAEAGVTARRRARAA